MKRLGASTFCMAVCAVLLEACGPAPKGAVGAEGETSGKPEASKGADPDPLEVPESERVSAMTFVKDLGMALGSPVDTHRAIRSASNQWAIGCNDGASRDLSYVWKAPSAGSYMFSTTGSNFDTVLEVRGLGATSGPKGCNDDVGNGLNSRLNLDVAENESVLIIIEGYSGEYGTLTRLNILKN